MDDIGHRYSVHVIHTANHLLRRKLATGCLLKQLLVHNVRRSKQLYGIFKLVLMISVHAYDEVVACGPATYDSIHSDDNDI